MKNTVTRIVNYEKTICDKKKKFQKCDMAPFILGKALEYFEIKESLPSEDLTKYCFCKEYFYMFFSTLKDTIM